MGADDAVAAAQRDKMDGYLRSKNMEEVDVDPTRMAEGIMQKLGEEARPAAANTNTNVKADAVTEQGLANDPLSALDTKPHRPATVAHEVFGEAPKKPAAAQPKSDAAPAPKAAQQAQKAQQSGQRTGQQPGQLSGQLSGQPSGQSSGQQSGQTKTAEPAARPARPASSAQQSKPAAARPHTDDPIADPITDPEYYQSRGQKKSAPTASLKEENKTLFWILFCIAVPLGAILCIIGAVAFLGLIALLAAVAIGFVVALIAVVAVGCSIALIGVIYGLYKIVSGAVPIGLYEVGLGITVGSAASFVGILMYNIAIRLVPFLMKKLAELISFGFRKARDGFVALKGALEDQ